MVNDHRSTRSDGGGGPCSLQLVHCLGLRSGNSANSPVQFIREDVLLFLSGRHLVLYDTVSHRQALIPCPGVVLCFTVHVGTRRLAFLEDEDGQPIIRVRKLIAERFPFPEEAGPVDDVVEPLCDLEWDSGTSSVHSIAFSHTAEQVAAVAWDGTLKLWTLPEATLVNSWQVPHEGHCLAFSPSAEDCYISVVGGGKLSVWSCDCNHVVSIGNENEALNSHEITSAAWIDCDLLAIGTEAGNCMVVTAGQEIRQTIVGHQPVYAIRCFQYRFVTVGAGGHVAVYQFHTAHRSAESVQTLITPEGLDLHCAELDPKGKQLVLIHGDGRCSQVSLLDGTAPSPLSPRNAPEPVPLDIGFHPMAVTALELCIQRPIVITTSTDFCLRIWDFHNLRLELRKSFDEEVFSAACHPTGLYLLLGFRYRLVLFFVLHGELSVLHEWSINCCRGLLFSRSGQHFAAGSVNRVFVFDTYTFECVASLQGQDDLITSLAFSPDGRRLLSGANNGCLMYWTLDGSFQSYSCVADGSVEAIQWCGEEAFVCLARTSDTGACRVVLQCFERGLLICSIPVARDDDPDVASSTTTWTPEQRYLSPRCHCLSYDGRIYRSNVVLCPAAETILVGTPQGTLQLYRLPLSVEEHQTPFAEYALHSGPVMHLRLSVDCRLLFSVGQDGAMVMAKVLPNALELTHPWPKPLTYNVYEPMFADGPRAPPTWASQAQARVPDNRRTSDASSNTVVEVSQPPKPAHLSSLVKTLKAPMDGDSSDSDVEHLDDMSDYECAEDLESMKQELSRIKHLLKKGDAKKVKLRMAVRDLQKQIREVSPTPHLSTTFDVSQGDGTPREIIIPLPPDRFAISQGTHSAAPGPEPPINVVSAQATPSTPTSLPRRVSSPIHMPPSLPRAASVPTVETQTPLRHPSGHPHPHRRETLPRSITPTRWAQLGISGASTPRIQSTVVTPRSEPARARTPPPPGTYLPDSSVAVPYNTYIAYKRRALSSSTSVHTPRVPKSSPVVPKLLASSSATNVAKPERCSLSPRPLSVRSGRAKTVIVGPTSGNTPAVPSLRDLTSRVASRSPARVSKPLGPNIASARSVPSTSPTPMSARLRPKLKRDTL